MSRGFSITAMPGFLFIALLCFVVLYLPVATLVFYAFNAGVSVAVWEGFSLRWFQSAWQNTAVQEATIRSAISITLMAIVMVALLLYVRNASTSGARHG